MMNMVTKKKAQFSSNETERANELNYFYLCFETEMVSQSYETQILFVAKMGFHTQ